MVPRSAAGRSSPVDRIRWTSLAILGWLTVLSLGPAAVAKDNLSTGLTFWLSFDKSADADSAGGSNKASVAVNQVAGKFGKAFESKGIEVSYPSALNIEMTRGSLSFWYMPKGDPKDMEPGLFFSLSDANFQLFCQPGQNQVFWMTAHSDDKNGFQWDYGTTFGLNRLEANKWTMITLVWNDQKKTKSIYIDGKLALSNPGDPFGKGSGSKLNVGGVAGTYDEFMVWNRPLNAAEVAQLFARGDLIKKDAAAAAPNPEPTWDIYADVIRQPMGASLVPPNQSVSLNAPFENRTTDDLKGTATFTVLDLWSKPALKPWTVPLSLDGGEKKEIPLKFQLPRLGYYRVQVAVTVKGKTRTRDLTTLGCVPNGVPPAQPMLGAHVNQREGSPEMARRLGLCAIRVHDMSQFTWWTRLERTRGDWDAAAQVDAYNRYKAAGFSVFGEWFAAPNWAVKLDDGTTPPQQEPGAYPAAWVPTDQDALKTYVRKTLELFPDIKEYDVWNEPHVSMFWRGSVEEYVNMAKVIMTEAKADRPDITGYAQLIDEGPWSRKALSLGILDYCNGVSFHHYGSPDSQPRDSRANVEHLHKMISELAKKDPKTVPLVMSEGGVWTGPALRALDRPNLLPPSKQPQPRDLDAARVFVQRNIVWNAMGVKAAYYYFFGNDDGEDMLEFTDTPRPTALACNALAWQLDGGSVAGDTLDPKTGLYAAAYDRQDGTSCTIVWAEEGAELDAELPGNVYDIMGNPLPAPAGKKFHVGAMPLYVRSPAKASAQLAAMKSLTPTVTKAPQAVLTVAAGEKPAFTSSGNLAIAGEMGEQRMHPIDLMPIANMGLIDEKAGDGKGGVFDEGPFNDAPMIKPGLQHWAGVPFMLAGKTGGDKQIVVMGGRTFPTGPKQVDLPVKLANVRGLVFAHAGNWMNDGDVVGTYVISYADGTNVELPIRCGHEIGDWWASHERTPEEDSRTMGFLHPEPMDPKAPYRYVRVWYWSNPNMDKTITNIQIRGSTGAPTFGVFGITAAQS